MSAQFREAVKELLITKGYPVDLKTSWWWGFSYDFDAQKHKNSCAWFATDESEIKEIVFSEFDGTDCDAQQSTALILTHVKCSCGKYTDISLGRQGSTGELLSELLGPIERTYK